MGGTKSTKTIQLGHGSGGALSHSLLEGLILPALDSKGSSQQGHDSAVIDIHKWVGENCGRLAFTTDSYVVNPRSFPGGDIGSLAVYGTVNDLAMSGARPKWMSVGLILEEGFPIEELQLILQSLKLAADETGVEVVTGDTKVVERGKGDGLYINTCGIGSIDHSLKIGAESIEAGDVIVLSGDIGRHGICVLAAREELAFETRIETDSAPLHEPVLALIEAGLPLHCLRDLTRGGLASGLKELLMASKLSGEIWENEIPVIPEVAGACELLGLDPLYVANEGRMILVIPEAAAEPALKTLSGFEVSKDSRVIGKVVEGRTGQLVLRTTIGSRRLVEMLPGEQLPRIC